ncbi:recombinase family protein [Hyphomicrobium sp.]|uniref:recombinase family protein n=1 Tax=Hyphomicrobium sp. TaxID=82 RepID=UPI002FE061AE
MKNGRHKPRAYSYLRFSTPEQAHGDSRRRQADLAAQYAQEHGLELDDSSYADLGISAYKGKNVEVGALRRFLEAVEDGVVPQGSFLLVENLDRLTRDHIVPAQSLFLQIISAGVTIVTLADRRSYSVESVNASPTDLIISLLSMMRAHEESAIKGRRVRAAWDAKRRKAADEPLTARGPGWLRLDRTKAPPKWVVLKDRARTVKRIFKMAAKGIGQHTIAHTLNSEGVPTFGRGKVWHRSFVKKLLESAAVVGTLTPHTQSHDVTGRRVRTPGKQVPGYYPRIIDDELFNDVRAMRLEGRRQPSPKGSRRPTHMLAGLAQCGLCGASMTRVFKGAGPKGGKPKLVCSVAKVGAGCEYLGVNVEDVEQAIADSIGFLTGAAPAGDDHLDSELERLETLRMAIDDQLSNVADAIASGADSPTLRARMRALEAERELRSKEHDALLEKIAAVSRPSIEKRLATAHDLIARDADKAAINAALRQLLRAVVVDRKDGKLRFHWAHGGETELTFAWPLEDAEA